MTPLENDTLSPDDLDLARAIVQCGQDESFLQKILDVYEDITQADPTGQPRCMGGGACCRFDMFDHRLYVTLGELALLRRSEPVDISRTELNRCPYQQGPKCHARQNRPLGCRVFFCREKPDIRDNDVYETAHKRISQLHETHDLPYAYAELISALNILHKFCR